MTFLSKRPIARIRIDWKITAPLGRRFGKFTFFRGKKATLRCFGVSRKKHAKLNAILKIMRKEYMAPFTKKHIKLTYDHYDSSFLLFSCRFVGRPKLFEKKNHPLNFFQAWFGFDMGTKAWTRCVSWVGWLEMRRGVKHW